MSEELREVEVGGDVGRCGNELRGILDARSYCSLRAGHAGWHEDGDGASWSRTANGTREPTGGQGLRTLLLRVRELEATVARVEALADRLDEMGDEVSMHWAADRIRRALDGDQ